MQLRNLFLLTLGLTLSAGAQAAPNLSFCYDKVKGNKLRPVKVKRQEYKLDFPGTLCAIKPSDTDTRSMPIKDKGDTNLGFGYHVVGVPDNLNENTPVLLHFTGSYGRAYDQSKSGGNGQVRGGEFSTQLFLGEAVKKGYFVIQLAYANYLSVNLDICNGTRRNRTYDYCSSNARFEILFGDNLSDKIQVSESDSWNYRLSRLLIYLQRKGITIPSSLRPRMRDIYNWTNLNELSFSGHSQGAGHAHLIGKFFRTKSVCLISGGYDRADMQNPINHKADWLNIQSPYQTSTQYFGGVVVDGEDYYTPFVDVFEDDLQMTRGIDYFVGANKEYHNRKGELVVEKIGRAHV